MICARTPRPLDFVGLMRLEASSLLLALWMKMLGVEEESEHYDHLVRDRKLEESVYHPCLTGLMGVTSTEVLALVPPTVFFSWCLDSGSWGSQNWSNISLRSLRTLSRSDRLPNLCHRPS